MRAAVEDDGEFVDAADQLVGLDALIGAEACDAHVAGAGDEHERRVNILPGRFFDAALARTCAGEDEESGDAAVGERFGMGCARRSEGEAADELGGKRAEGMSADADMSAIEFSGGGGDAALDFVEGIDGEGNIASAIAPGGGIGDIFAESGEAFERAADFAGGFALGDGIVVSGLDDDVAARGPVLSERGVGVFGAAETVRENDYRKFAGAGGIGDFYVEGLVALGVAEDEIIFFGGFEWAGDGGVGGRFGGFLRAIGVAIGSEEMGAMEGDGGEERHDADDRDAAASGDGHGMRALSACDASCSKHSVERFLLNTRLEKMSHEKGGCGELMLRWCGRGRGRKQRRGVEI